MLDDEWGEEKTVEEEWRTCDYSWMDEEWTEEDSPDTPAGEPSSKRIRLPEAPDPPTTPTEPVTPDTPDEKPSCQAKTTGESKKDADAEEASKEASLMVDDCGGSAPLRESSPGDSSTRVRKPAEHLLAGCLMVGAAGFRFTSPAGKDAGCGFTSPAGKNAGYKFTSPAGKNVGCDVNELQCQYERGGWCTLHKAQGRKGMKVTKVWDRLKTGLYGYKVMRRVTYKCDISVFDGSKDDFPSTTTMDEFGATASGLSQGGQNCDFTGVTGAMKRPRLQSVCNSDSNPEPKANGKRARLD